MSNKNPDSRVLDADERVVLRAVLSALNPSAPDREARTIAEHVEMTKLYGAVVARQVRGLLSDMGHPDPETDFALALDRLGDKLLLAQLIANYQGPLAKSVANEVDRLRRAHRGGVDIASEDDNVPEKEPKQ